MSDVTYLLHVSATFDAAHRHLQGHLHGHHWEVTAVIESDPAAYTQTWGEELPERLDAIARELDGRDLADMIPGGAHSPLIVANWVFERLASSFEDLVAVKVSDGRIAGTKDTA